MGFTTYQSELAHFRQAIDDACSDMTVVFNVFEELDGEIYRELLELD